MPSERELFKNKRHMETLKRKPLSQSMKTRPISKPSLTWKQKLRLNVLTVCQCFVSAPYTFKEMKEMNATILFCGILKAEWSFIKDYNNMCYSQASLIYTVKKSIKHWAMVSCDNKQVARSNV